ncbi:hypothetical protein [Brevundimonas naejangsanensis]|uniref:hypothetical protein n=1 Tax=Brevundimonas naejangsanensis TaxID=588932 RepID=UPI0026EF45C6|nr:hypothetical protein [Brevundimonas naejangsanensis]
MPEVITWTSADHGAIARIRMPMPSKGGSKIGWSPVVIHADTEEQACEKAHAFYHSELERLSARADGKARRLEKMAAARAAKTQQVQP